MAFSVASRGFVIGRRTLLNSSYLSTSCSCMIKWRFEKGIEPNPNRYGVLTNAPDYSFVDGRTVPLSLNTYKRMKLQEYYCEQIIKLNNEIDFAIEKHKEVVEENRSAKEKFLSSKLKPKGELLSKKKEKL